MKSFAVGTMGVLALLLLSVGFVSAKDSTFSGEIMDSQCAKVGSHETMMKKHDIKTEKECTNGCVKGGGKYVLFDASTKTIYQLDDQTKPAQFAGEKVKVSGTYDKATKTIHIADIKSSS
ncbi:MAG TPA: hypothetical protein VKT71_07585 [Candidatus Acidoferrales bacterium]|nr:hypothetical protein [Candidatus Acidoferrales bacterium]